jgi:hypothetical protein
MAVSPGPPDVSPGPPDVSPGPLDVQAIRGHFTFPSTAGS